MAIPISFHPEATSDLAQLPALVLVDAGLERPPYFTSILLPLALLPSGGFWYIVSLLHSFIVFILSTRAFESLRCARRER